MAQQKNAPQNALVVDMWSDLICPWCRIGEKHFEKALAMFEHRDSLRFSLRSYRLMPGSETMPVEQVMRDKYRFNQKEMSQGFANIEETAQGVGLHYRLAGSWAGDTMDAHRLLKFAKTVGKKQSLFNRFYSAAMSEQRCIQDHAVLRELAVAEGLAEADIDRVLAGDEYRSEVEADEKAMKDYGGNGVPYFVINGKYSYSGAVSPAIILSALTRAWDESNPDASGSSSGESSGDSSGALLAEALSESQEKAEDGIACGPDGCKLT